jgi:hypothetical protein
MALAEVQLAEMRDYMDSVDKTLMQDELEIRQIDELEEGGCYEGDLKVRGGSHGCPCSVRTSVRHMNKFLDKLDKDPCRNVMEGTELGRH